MSLLKTSFLLSDSGVSKDWRRGLIVHTTHTNFIGRVVGSSTPNGYSGAQPSSLKISSIALTAFSCMLGRTWL